MKAQRIKTLLLAAAVLVYVMPRAASASGLVENWDSLASWQTRGDARIEPAGQLLLRGSPSVTSAYQADLSLADAESYKLTVVAKVDSYTAGAENLGFKISGGMRRLMFQRRSDGFYAITSASAGAWVQVHPTSEYTGWGEYEFTVTKGEVSLRTRRWPNGTWDHPTTWTLPQYGAEQRVEVWVKGTAGDAHVDRLALSDLAPAVSTITFINENATEFPEIGIYIDCQTVLGKWQKVCDYQQAQGERYPSVVRSSGREVWTDGAVAGEVYLAKLNEDNLVESVTATRQDQTIHVKLRSKSSTDPVRLTLVNISPKTQDVFWYDYQGNRVKYATLKPGQGYTQSTYATHPWAIGRHLYIPNSQGEQANVSSYDSSTPVKVKFENPLPLPVDLYWVDYQGKQVKYATIMPFSSTTVSTFFSHPWIARLAGTETILGFYDPDAPSYTVANESEPAVQTYVIGPS